ncbi:hypothetical protein AVEN_42682-1 [Araneus ventricosus]|uniref:Gustatory receptor n=1 Tax=Araneus ventricosus TaxID=182803 RepID=A0A4Y2BPY8_ARAVE|nr:hypothetical protein AVEN_42682-1 [Araneus ventricosus]
MYSSFPKPASMKKGLSNNWTMGHTSHSNSLRYSLMILLLCGITLSNSKESIMVSRGLGLVFHVVCFSVLVQISCCFYRFRSSFAALTVITNALTLFTWWALYTKRMQYTKVIHRLKRCGLSKCSWALIFARFSFVVLLTMIFFPSAASTVMLNYSTNTDRRCNECWFKIPSVYGKNVYNFFLQVFREFINWGFTYTIASFYSSTCLEINGIVCKLIRDMKSEDLHIVQQRKKRYRRAVLIMADFESSMSFTIFLVFCNCFNEFFRGLTQILHNPQGNERIRISVIAFAYFIGSGITFITAVFTADNLQHNFGLLRNLMLETSDPTSTSSNLSDLLQHDLTLLEDKDNVHLTAWDMFEVRKGLIITTLASLISYSVILGQLKI